MQLRAARPADLTYLAELARRPEVEPLLAPRADESLREIAAEATGEPFGLFAIERDDGEVIGGLALEQGSVHSRICNLRMLMVDPAARGSGLGTEAVRMACRRALVEHGCHRMQTESYGENLVAHRCFERVGFVREGVRRQAYWRGGSWRDGILYGLLAEELR